MSPIEKPEPSLDYPQIGGELNGHVITTLGDDNKLQNRSSDDCATIINNNNKNYINKLCRKIDDYPKCNRNRQLFGIQLEVTSLLLEAERRKLAVLQRELQVALEDSGSIKKAKEQLKQELILAISRIQLQYDLLEKEYKQHAIGRLRSSNTRGLGKSNRSQPAIGLKQTPKARPTIFGTVASDQCPKDSVNRRGLPQTIASCSTKSVDKQYSLPLTVCLDSQKDIIDSDENALVYRDGNLISGPLDALIQHMVPTSDYYPDRSYLFAFLLSARLFIRPHELLAKICQLCEEQQNFSCRTELDRDQTDHHPAKVTNNQLSSATDTDSTECCQKLRAFAQHFVQLLAEWIDTFPYDFRDDRLMQHVRSMTRKCINIDNALRKDVSTILQNLLQRLTVLEKYEEFLLSLSRGCNDCTDSNQGIKSPLTVSQNISVTSEPNTTATSQQSPPPPLPPSSSQSTNYPSTNSLASSDISELCPNPTLLAHQLTHIELERLSYIGPEEFVQAFAKENPHLEQSFCDMKKTRNLESYVQWFNRLSYLVATEIVKHPKKKQRVRIVEYWIETGRECFNIGNFNSLMAIIAGLNMSPISRLKKTWAKVQLAKFSVLEHQMDPSSNFNSYRSTLKAAMWRSAGATDERERIVIPFFSLLVKDLYFLNEGCSNKLPNGHINFEKFWQLAKQVTEFIAWKQVTCPFEKLPKVIMFLQTNTVLNENTLAMASFECEPPDNNHEKDRFKSLKSEQNQQHQL